MPRALINFACVATEMKLYLPYLQALLPDLVVLGLNTKWEGFITKYKLLQAYLSTLKDEDIICFIDAYDVLPTQQVKQLQANYEAFEAEHPHVKMIVGYDRVDNFIHEYLSREIFGTVNAPGQAQMRLNSGQFIGRVKNIREIISYILENTAYFLTDQVELTKYANEMPGDVYIDAEQHFFYVKSKPLQQILPPANKRGCAFVHANGNGFLDTFLAEEHGIKVGYEVWFAILLANLMGVVRKIAVYDLVYAKKYIKFFLDQLAAKLSAAATLGPATLAAARGAATLAAAPGAATHAL